MMQTNQTKLYITICLLWVAHFLVDLMIGIWPVYKTMMHLDLAKAGLIAAACAFAGEGMQVVFGSLSDRGYGKILIIGGVAAAAANSLLSYTADYWILFFLFLLTCLGSGAFHPASVGLLGNLTENRKSLYITIFASGGGLGIALSQLIFSNSYTFFNGNTMFLAIPALCVVILASFFRFSEPKVRSTSSGHALNFRAYGDFFRRRELVLLYASQVCNQSLTWGTVFLLPDVLVWRGYETWIAFGGGHFCYAIGGALMMVPGGYLADRYSSKVVIITATVLGMIFFYTFLFIPFQSTIPLLGILLLMGATMNVVNPVSIAFGTKMMPENPGIASACLMGLVWCVAEGIGQGGGGLLTKLFEEDAAARALACLGGLFLVGLLAASRLPSRVPDRSVLEV